MNLDVARFVKRPLFTWFQCFSVVKKKYWNNGNENNISYSPFKFYWHALLQTKHYVNNFVHKLIKFLIIMIIIIIIIIIITIIIIIITLSFIQKEVVQSHM